MRHRLNTTSRFLWSNQFDASFITLKLARFDNEVLPNDILAHV